MFSDRPKQGGVFKLFDTDLKKFPAPSAPDIIMNYQHYVIFLLSAAPQAKILPFLMRFTTDFALKIAFPKANNSQDPQNFLRPRSQIRPKQGGVKVRVRSLRRHRLIDLLGIVDLFAGIPIQYTRLGCSNPKSKQLQGIG